MSFGEIFAPGMGHMNDEKERERILPAPTPIAGAPPLDSDNLASQVIIPDIAAMNAPVMPDPPTRTHDDAAPDDAAPDNS